MLKLKKMLGNLKVRYKLIMIYLCIGFLPFLILGMIYYYQVKDLLSQEEILSSKNYIDQATVAFDNSLHMYNNLSDDIAFDQIINYILTYQTEHPYEFYQQITNVIDPTINSIKYLHNEINRITIYTSTNQIKHDNTLAPISQIQNEEWYQAVMSSSNTQWYVDRNQDIVFLVRKMPLLAREGVEGVLYIELDFSDVFKHYYSSEFADYDVFIVDQNKRLIHSIHQHHEEAQLQYHQFLNLQMNQDQNILSRSSETTGWTISLYRTTLTSHHIFRLSSILIMIALVLFAIVVFVALVSTSQLMTGRIEKLMKNMKQVENGILVVDVESEYNDEIGSLITGFKKMVEQINKLIQEVYVEKLLQREYEMRALQQQINPHFLYNTLSMINFKALEVGEKDISKITLDLSAFYRTSLNKGKNICTIEDELNNMRAYMDIQLMMHDYDFDFYCYVEDDIYPYESLNLILQPIVENALKHGIDLLEERRGCIEVRVIKKDECIYMIVSDNGVGMSQEMCETILAKESKGYGIRNVNERLQLYYGIKYGLSVESTMNVGTKMTIKMPAKLLEK